MTANAPRIHVPKPFRDALWIAVEYDTSYVGPEHVLVAVLRSPGRCRSFLNRELQAGSLQECVSMLQPAQTSNEQSDPPRADESPRPSPAFYKTLGLAEAFAAALGDGPADDVATLLALWWDASGEGALLRRWGIGKSEIDALLEETGFATPRVYPDT
jgi:hypothetical protein